MGLQLLALVSYRVLQGADPAGGLFEIPHPNAYSFSRRSYSRRITSMAIICSLIRLSSSTFLPVLPVK
jgi:hypothetical protein